MQWVRLLHQRSSRKKGYWMNLKKKKKNFCARQKLEWLLPISSTRSRPSLEVATCRGRDLARLQWVSGWTVGIDVATSFEVATWVAAREVATWRRDVAEMRLR